MVGAAGLALFLGFASALYLSSRRVPSEAVRQAAGTRFALRFRTYVAPDATTTVDAMLERDRRSLLRVLAALVALFGVVVAVSAWLGVPDETALVALAVGAPLVPALTELVRRLSSGPAGAPAATHTTGDFVPPALRAGVVGFGLCGIAVACWVAVSPSASAHASTVVMALVPAIAALAAELGAALVSRAGHRLPQDLHYVEDAARSEQIGRSYTSVGVLGPVALSFALGDQDRYGLGLACVAALLALAVLRTWPTPQHLYFRQRLWPELEPDEILVSPVTTSPA